MIHIVAVLSTIGVLLVPAGGFLGTKDCKRLNCVPSNTIDGPWQGNNDDTPSRPPRRGPRTPRPRPDRCAPRDPRPAEPDIARVPIPKGKLIHEAGSGPVVVGMDTEYRWVGPRQVSWTQPSRPGVREDCSTVPGEPTRFTATLQTLVFEFEQGERKRYFSDDGSVTHRYTTIPADEGEEQFTVCVYAGYEIPGEGFATLMLVAQVDHDVVEIRSTLVE
jgi:hypothetical protein